MIDWNLCQKTENAYKRFYMVISLIYGIGNHTQRETYNSANTAIQRFLAASNLYLLLFKNDITQCDARNFCNLAYPFCPFLEKILFDFSIFL